MLLARPRSSGEYRGFYFKTMERIKQTALLIAYPFVLAYLYATDRIDEVAEGNE